MEVKLKNLHLINFCGYRDSYFDFTDENGNPPRHLTVFYGPNGAGKSNILNAASLAACAGNYEKKDNSLIFRKLAFHNNYNPVYSGFDLKSEKMRVVAHFDVDGEDKEVVLEYDPSIINPYSGLPKEGYETNGVVKNELPKERDKFNQLDWARFIDADNPMNMRRFQLPAEVSDKFLDICEAVYGYECGLENKVVDKDSFGTDVEFYTDFILDKSIDYGGEQTLVHFKRMSDGEKKIATLVAELCEPTNENDYSLFLVDNIVMHIYIDRHARLIDKLEEYFGHKQILATTHSAVLVGAKDMFEGYLPPENKCDLIQKKREGK